MYVTCTHTKGNRTQECILVLVADRLACIPIGPAQNAVGKLAAGLAMTAVGVITIRLGSTEIDVSQLETAEQLVTVVEDAHGFYVDETWSYRTGIPVIGTMLLHGNENLTTRKPVPPEMFAKLTLDRAPLSPRIPKLVAGIGLVIIAGAVITYLATGSLELLFGIGFWGLVPIGASAFAWRMLRRTYPA